MWMMPLHLHVNQKSDYDYDDTSVLALKISLRGVGMYLGPPCNGFALNCHLFYLAIPGTRPLCMNKQYLFVLFICNRKK